MLRRISPFLVVAGVAAAIGYRLADDSREPMVSPPAPSPGTFVLPDFAGVVERVNAAVVSVTAGEGAGRAGLVGSLRRMLEGERGYETESAGSGFLISPDGYLFTSHHVIEDADAISVELADGQQLSARLIGFDRETDLALLKVATDRDLPHLELGDSDEVRVGEWVCAIGNPLIYARSVTVGVVSAKGRRLHPGASFESYLQTDAAINLGNSGGPLVDVRGRVIGINTAVSAQGQNIGFAVPVNIARDILPDLRRHGRVVRGYLGVEVDLPPPALRQRYDLASEQGVLVSDVEPGGAADRAGIRSGDIILEIDGEPVGEPRSLVRQISRRAPGRRVDVRVLRDGRPHVLSARLRERADAADETTLGIAIASIDGVARDRWEIARDVPGVVVTDVVAGGVGERAGLRRGDVILEIDREPVRGVGDARRRLRSSAEGARLLWIDREGARSFVALSREER